MLDLDLTELAVSIILLVISVAVTFYLKDYLERRSDFGKLRKKLQAIAGKGAQVVYFLAPSSDPSVGPQLYKIKEIDRQGVTLENDLQTVFVPAAKLLHSEIIVPSDNFNATKGEMLKADFDKIGDALIPTLFEKMIPAMKELLKDQLKEGEEVAAIIGFKVKNVLEQEGFEIKKSKS